MARRRSKRPLGRPNTSGRRSKGTHVIEGILHVTRPGVATISSEEGSFTVAKAGIREGMNGDRVRATLSKRSGEEVRAYVQSVIERASTTFLGSYHTLEPLGVVVPLDERIRRDFFILPEDDCARRLGVAEDDLVAARILAYPSRNEAGVATIERRVGASSDLDLNIEGIIASYDLAIAFPEEALAEARAYTLDVEGALANDRTRRDLRGEYCFTIDPADAKDFDDAVFAEETDGGFRLCVHIADVSHYVAWGSSVDIEARRRTTSVYLVDRVLPMLPEELSNDLCSLKPDEDRLCMSVIVELDAKGEVIEADAFPSVIRSRARLDYDHAQAILDGAEHAADGVPAQVVGAIRILDRISKLRQEVRRRRGSIDFESVESRVVLDEAGKPLGVSVRRKTDATELIEEAMLVANECVAKRLADLDLESAYRVHEPPAQDTLSQALPVLREMGFAKGEQGDALLAGNPEATRAVLEQAAGTPSEYMVNALLLRSQMRAVYLPRNEGHYALGADAYCHFTSPIRRYPDVIVHRTLKMLLRGELESRARRDQLKVLPQLLRDCSDRERTADAASRASQKVKMAEYYADRIGKSYSGIISGVESYGLFVMLDDTYAEGLLPVRDLGEEWFSYDEARMTLTGESTGKVYRLGRRIAVAVAETDPAKGRIDFVLAGSGLH